MTSPKDVSQPSNIVRIQKILFYLSLVVIPLSVIPLPWDLTELSMGLMMMTFSTLILGLELIRFFKEGSLEIAQSKIDKGTLAIVASALLSTIFSISTYTSNWGYDYRLGSGFLVLALLFLYALSARSFIRSTSDVVKGLFALVMGVGASALFSLMSFYNFNLFALFPSYNDLFTLGLPLYSSARVSLIAWGTSSLISTFLIIWGLTNHKKEIILGGSLSLVTTLVATLLFSINQGVVIATVLLGIFIAALVVPYMRGRKVPGSYTMPLLIITAVFGLLFGLLRIPQVQEAVISGNKNVITQLPIDQEVSWDVASSAVSETMRSGAFGLGYDSFSVAYNRYRGLTDETVLLNSTNFTYAYNHILNTLANTGLLGLAAWGLLVYLIAVDLIKMFKKGLEKIDDLLSFVVSLVVVFILIASLFSYFNFIVLFLLFIVMTMKVLLNTEGAERFVIKMDMFVEKYSANRSRTLSTGMTIVVIFVAGLSLYWIGANFMASNKTIEAERTTAVAREKELNGDLSDIEREEVLIEASNLYAEAVRLNPNNAVSHRRAALIISQYSTLLVADYNETEDADDKEELFDEISTYIEIMTEESERATDLAPAVYSNWETRSSIYTNLISMGLTAFTQTALSTLQQAALLNPLNYDIYYNAAQLYIVDGDVDSALRSLNQVFTINTVHVPSLVLAGELSESDGDMTQAERFFDTAKDAMEDFGSTDSSIYDYVVDKLTALTGGAVLQEAVEEASETTEEETEAETDSSTEDE